MTEAAVVPAVTEVIAKAAVPAVTTPAATVPPVVPAAVVETTPAAVVPDSKPAAKPLALTLPKDALIDADDLAAVTAFATEHGLTQAQAEKLVERDNATIKDFIDDQKHLVSKQSEAWRAAVVADKDFGGAKLSESSELGKRFITRMAGPDAAEVAGLLDRTGLGNHPAIFRFLARAGKAMAEDNPAGATTGGSTTPKSFADALYGGSAV